MSSIGYYRYKTTADIYKQVHLNLDGTNIAVKYVQPINTCGNDIILKYLDKNGQYRFYPFNKYYRTSDAPELIGQANKFVTNILSDQTDRQNIGFRNTRKIEIVADVPNDELEKLHDIYSSPRVYMYIGSGSDDAAKDWIEVNQITDTGIVKRRKANEGRINLTIILPTNFSITMV
jgi:hypothetical protein